MLIIHVARSFGSFWHPEGYTPNSRGLGNILVILDQVESLKFSTMPGLENCVKDGIYEFIGVEFMSKAEDGKS